LNFNELIDKLKSILSEHWGTETFRPLQLDIITSILTKNNTLALLPTGGGKSVCYQVPAIYEDGMCLVVSPLIALMKDQVEDLLRKKIPAAAVFSGMSFSEIENTLNNAINKNYKILYVSPERLKSDNFRLKIPNLPIKFIAVDEAHCISEWGYDFRPAYLEIAKIKELLPNLPVLALTATATPEVRKDIIGKLQMKDVKIFEKSFNRDNLIYGIVNTESKFNSLLQIVRKVSGSCIIYGRTRRQVKEASDFLNQNKISADYYHAGLDNKTRSIKQDRWKKGTTRVIVATNAFGMGIDKLNVRMVMHLQVPDSLEAYYQEAGRAGRDFKTSYAIVLFSKPDENDLDNRIENIFPTKKEIQVTYQSLCNYLKIPLGSGIDTEFDFDLQNFCNHYNLDIQKTSNILQFLQREGLIFISEKDMMPSRIFILVNYLELYNFQIMNPKYEAIIKTLLRSYEGLFDLYTKINEGELAQRIGLSIEKTISLLIGLKKMDIIDYIPAKNKPQIVLLHNRVEALDLYEIYKNLENRKLNYQKRLEWVKKYTIENIGCRSKVLLKYFGEVIDKNCGHCDYCLKVKDVNLSSEEFNEIYNCLVELLTKKTLSLNEIKSELNVYNELKLVASIEWLVKQGKLYEDKLKNICLNL